MHHPVILVLLDGSPEAEQALPEAEAAARSFGHPLRLLGIVDPSPAAGAAAPALSLNFPVLQRRTELERYLHRLAWSLQQRGIMAEAIVLCEPPDAALPGAVAAPEVALTLIARSGADAEAQAAALERLLAAAAGEVRIVQPQLQPA